MPSKLLSCIGFLYKIERRRKKFWCRKHLLPIAFLSCVFVGAPLKLAVRLSTSVSSSGRPLAKTFQGHAERRRRALLDHFSRILFAPLSGLLQCQTPLHRDPVRSLPLRFRHFINLTWHFFPEEEEPGVEVDTLFRHTFAGMGDVSDKVVGNFCCHTCVKAYQMHLNKATGKGLWANPRFVQRDSPLFSRMRPSSLIKSMTHTSVKRKQRKHHYRARSSFWNLKGYLQRVFFLKACWKQNVSAQFWKSCTTLRYLKRWKWGKKMPQIPMLLSWNPDLPETSFLFHRLVESVN